ncbi:MAG: hypothetical protein AB1758_20970, partial [Candidatus Eremiobacterota bacterium]
GTIDADPTLSGTTLAVTRETRYGPEGQASTVEQIGATRAIVGTSETGRSASHTESVVYTNRDGRPVTTVQREETRGLYGAVLPAELKEEYADRLREGLQPGETVNHRSQIVDTYDPEGNLQDTESIDEYGNYDHPREDGRTVRVRKADGATLYGYSKVSDGGHRVQSQVSVQGTDLYMLSDERRKRGGGFVRDTRVMDGEEQLSETHESRRRVRASEVPEGPYRDDFLRRAGEGPIFRYDREVREGDSVQSVRQFATRDGGLALTRLARRGDVDHTATLLKDGESLKIDSPAGEIRVGDDGEVRWKGQVLGQLESPDGLSAAGAGLDVVSKTRSLLKDLPLRGVTGANAGLDLVSGTLDLMEGLKQGDASAIVGGGGTLSSGAGSLSGIGEQLVAGNRATSLLGLGRVGLGALGGAAGVGGGIYEITQGNVRDGILDSVTAGAGGVAALGIATGPLAALSLAALGVRLGLDGIEGEQLPPLQI